MIFGIDNSTTIYSFIEVRVIVRNKAFNILKIGILAGVALELSLLSGCAMLQPKTDEEQVALKAQARQDALLIHDYKAAYKFFSPGYRETHTYQQYIGRKGGAVKRVSASINTVECVDNMCNVNVDLYYKYQGILGVYTKDSAKPNHRVNKEKWIKVGNKWWLYSKK